MAAASASLFRLRLTVKSGPDAGKGCVVDRDVVTVGKMADCDLVLSDASVSRRHLRITRESADRWRLVDLGSTNGTFVAGARVTDAPIEAGAILVAGKVEIAFIPERQDVVVPPWPHDHFGPLIGRSTRMRQLFGLMARISSTDATVLIQGETGCGKGLAARAIQQASSRVKGAYVVVDCGAVQRQLVESELFGHEKGAFTGAYDRRIGAFELANNGTVFIDELGELGLDLQPKLLRVLDAREVRRVGGPGPTAVDIRVIASSRRDLEREVARGAFREDLYFRLSVVTLRIPPLRDRPEDIPMLAEHFLEEVATTRGVPVPRMDGKMIDRLTSHDWPGNVRELRNVVERAVLMSAVRPGQHLEVGQLASNARAPRPKQATISSAPSFDPTLSFTQSKERWLDVREHAYVRWLLDANAGNVSAAARAARMDRKYLHKLIKKYGG